MKDATKSSGSIWERGPFWFGVALSALVICFGCYSLTQWPVCGGVGPCMSNWDQLRFRASPNEIGDMLAGFAGTLAFIWIVVTVLLQASELREQREQFEKMADAQEAQAELLEKQGKIFEDEQRQRIEVRTEKLLNQRLTAFVRFYDGFDGPKWKYLVLEKEGRGSSSGEISIVTWIDHKQDIQSQFEKIVWRATEVSATLKRHYDRNEIISFPDIRAKDVEVLTQLERILGLVDALSEAQAERLEHIGAFKLHDAWTEILSDQYWRVENNAGV